ncbi:FAD-binding domain-containing protein, partial [Dendrothele bispora CBS 962.96]
YFSAEESQLSPSCRVNPTSADEVAQVLNITTQFGCKFAVRSGGHMPWAGAANIDQPGVTIDLGFLNTTTLSEDKSTAHVGPGSRWGAVYSALAPEGRVVVGGRSTHVGAGGYLLGGYQMVLANGTIVEVNEQENADLFWAMHLGSTNFGIVTRYDLKTTEDTRMWGGHRFYNRSHALEAAEALLDFNEKSGDQGLDSMGFDLGSNEVFFMDYSRIKPENDTDVFQAPLSVPFVRDTTRANATLTSLIEEIDAAYPIGAHVSFRTLAFKPDAQFMIDWWQEGLRIFKPYEGNPNLNWTLIYAPMPLSMIKAAEAVDDPQGLSSKNGSLILTNLTGFWMGNLDEDDIQSKLAQLLNWGRTTAEQRGLFNQWIYLNYASPDQDPYAGIPTANAQRLRDIRQSVDPDGVFKSLWPGGFKL